MTHTLSPTLARRLAIAKQRLIEPLRGVVVLPDRRQTSLGKLVRCAFGLKISSFIWGEA